jgi:hypothetical protein
MSTTEFHPISSNAKQKKAINHPNFFQPTAQDQVFHEKQKRKGKARRRHWHYPFKSPFFAAA